MPLIDMQHLNFAYREHAVLRDVNLQLDVGEHLAVIGGNGCGKTTFGHWLSGRLVQGETGNSSGSLLIDGRPWSAFEPLEHARTVQFVGQLPEQQITGLAATVADEVAFGARNLGLSAVEVDRRVEQVLRACELQALAQANPFELSGGELQRLGIGAAMAMQPKVLILDEPGSNLDPASRQVLINTLRQLRQHTTLVLLDVCVEFALQLATRFAILEAGQLHHFAEPDAFLRAADRFGTLTGSPVADVGLALRARNLRAQSASLPTTVAALVSELKDLSDA